MLAPAVQFTIFSIKFITLTTCCTIWSLFRHYYPYFALICGNKIIYQACRTTPRLHQFRLLAIF